MADAVKREKNSIERMSKDNILLFWLPFTAWHRYSLGFITMAICADIPALALVVLGQICTQKTPLIGYELHRYSCQEGYKKTWQIQSVLGTY